MYIYIYTYIYIIIYIYIYTYIYNTFKTNFSRATCQPCRGNSTSRVQDAADDAFDCLCDAGFDDYPRIEGQAVEAVEAIMKWKMKTMDSDDMKEACAKHKSFNCTNIQKARACFPHVGLDSLQSLPRQQRENMGHFVLLCIFQTHTLQAKRQHLLLIGKGWHFEKQPVDVGNR